MNWIHLIVSVLEFHFLPFLFPVADNGGESARNSDEDDDDDDDADKSSDEEGNHFSIP